MTHNFKPHVISTLNRTSTSWTTVRRDGRCAILIPLYPFVRREFVCPAIFQYCMPGIADSQGRFFIIKIKVLFLTHIFFF